MRPIDPALIRRSGSIRVAIIATVLTGLVAAAASVIQAGAAAAVITRVFLKHAELAAVRGYLIAFACAWLVRAAVNSAQDVIARQGGLRAVAQLRREVALAYGSADATPESTLALLSRGIDALEIYVARYLPQLVLAVLVPIGLGAYILSNDLWSAVVLVITIPLIPLFMALIGWFTEDAVTRQWAVVGRITDVIEDLFSGLPDLVIFDRAKAQAKLIQDLGSQAASATMKVLRISFLSSLALELLATISVAIIALGIGLRLTNGEIGLEAGLAVLILAPDVYLPIRQVGTQFHAAVEGIGAWQQAQQLLAIEDERTVSCPASIDTIGLRDLVSGYATGLHAPINIELTAGTLTVITGRSGVGKSTLLRTIAGLAAPLKGSVEIGNVDTRTIRERDWFSRVAYVPQDPWLGHGTVREALTRGFAATDDECNAALSSVGLADLALDAHVDDLGSGVSIGQRRRVALARYRLRNCSLLLLDEPTAAVDAESEAAILRLLEQWCADGAIVVAVAHRAALIQAAHQVMHMDGVL